jgi:hypothetical protein
VRSCSRRVLWRWPLSVSCKYTGMRLAIKSFREFHSHTLYEGVSKSFRTDRLERELQMVQLSAKMCSCIAILWVSLVSFAAITLCVASQRVFIVVHFVMTQSGNFWIHPRISTTRWWKVEICCYNEIQNYCKQRRLPVVWTVTNTVRGCIQKFPEWVGNEITTINTRWEAT